MNQELARRIAVTIGALLLFRLGTNVPYAVADASTFTFAGRSISP